MHNNHLLGVSTTSPVKLSNILILNLTWGTTLGRAMAILSLYSCPLPSFKGGSDSEGQQGLPLSLPPCALLVSTLSLVCPHDLVPRLPLRLPNQVHPVSLACVV